MAKVIWSPAALEDVESIAEYIARDSVDQASLFVTRILETAERLSQFPAAGRVIPEIGEDACREVFVGFYRLMYRMEGQEVWITGIVHGARDWRPQ